MSDRLAALGLYDLITQLVPGIVWSILSHFARAVGLGSCPHAFPAHPSIEVLQ